MGNDFNQEQSEEKTIIHYVQKKTNKFGVAGFILSLLSAVFYQVHLAYLILCVLGFIISLIGLILGIFKRPKGFAIAGLVISIVEIILIFVLYESILHFLGWGLLNSTVFGLFF